MFVIQSEAKNLENINDMHTRSFVAMPLWMTDGYILKSATIIQYTIKGRFMSR